AHRGGDGAARRRAPTRVSSPALQRRLERARRHLRPTELERGVVARMAGHGEASREPLRPGRPHPRRPRQGGRGRRPLLRSHLRQPREAAPRPARMKLLSFALWGSAARYTVGALRNAELAPAVYPGWVCRFYCGTSVPAAVIRVLS